MIKMNTIISEGTYSSDNPRYPADDLKNIVSIHVREKTLAFRATKEVRNVSFGKLKQASRNWLR